MTCLLAYVALAHSLGFRLPDLIEPWRSIIVITAAVPTVLYAAVLAVQRRRLGARQEAKVLVALAALGYAAWVVLFFLIGCRYRVSEPVLAAAGFFAVAGGIPMVGGGGAACQSGGLSSRFLRTLNLAYFVA